MWIESSLLKAISKQDHTSNPSLVLRFEGDMTRSLNLNRVPRITELGETRRLKAYISDQFGSKIAHQDHKHEIKERHQLSYTNNTPPKVGGGGEEPAVVNKSLKTSSTTSPATRNQVEPLGYQDITGRKFQYLKPIRIHKEQQRHSKTFCFITLTLIHSAKGR